MWKNFNKWNKYIGGVQPHFCPWENCVFSHFSPWEKMGKKVYGKRGKWILFLLFPYTFFPIFPMGKNGKNTFFPWAKMGLDPPYITQERFTDESSYDWNREFQDYVTLHSVHCTQYTAYCIHWELELLSSQSSHCKPFLATLLLGAILTFTRGNTYFY